MWASSLIATGTPSSGRSCAAGVAGVGLVGLGERALGEDDAEGVEARVQALDALEGGLDDLTGRDIPLAHESRLLCRAGVGEIGGVHRCGEH